MGLAGLKWRLIAFIKWKKFIGTKRHFKRKLKVFHEYVMRYFGVTKSTADVDVLFIIETGSVLPNTATTISEISLAGVDSLQKQTREDSWTDGDRLVDAVKNVMWSGVRWGGGVWETCMYACTYGQAA